MSDRFVSPHPGACATIINQPYVPKIERLRMNKPQGILHGIVLAGQDEQDENIKAAGGHRLGSV